MSGGQLVRLCRSEWKTVPWNARIFYVDFVSVIRLLGLAMKRKETCIFVFVFPPPVGKLLIPVMELSMSSEWNSIEIEVKSIITVGRTQRSLWSDGADVALAPIRPCWDKSEKSSRRFIVICHVWEIHSLPLAYLSFSSSSSSSSVFMCFYISSYLVCVRARPPSSSVSLSVCSSIFS